MNGHLQECSIPQIDALLGVAGSTRPAVVLGGFNTWPDLPRGTGLHRHRSRRRRGGHRRPVPDDVRSADAPVRPAGLDPCHADMRNDNVDIGTVPASDHLPIVATLTLP